MVRQSLDEYDDVLSISYIGEYVALYGIRDITSNFPLLHTYMYIQTQCLVLRRSAIILLKRCAL